MEPDSSILHEARRSLFSLGIRRGFVTVDEIERELPLSSMTSAERWLLYYSLTSIDVEVRLGAELSASEPTSETA